MSDFRAFNFAPGPAMLPTEVMEKIQAEFLNYNSLGSSIIEISHRSTHFEKVLTQAKENIKKLANLPEGYSILFIHGGAKMQFSAIPMNLLGLKDKNLAYYVDSGNFAKIARIEAEKYGKIKIAATSEATNFDHIAKPDFNVLDKDASYIHITSNNTLFGTCWGEMPDTNGIPLVVDATSDIFSRKMDFSKTALVYAGLQKNLGPSGMALVIVRDDILGHAIKETPSLLNYEIAKKDNSLTNTTNTFAIYVTGCVLDWLVKKGGLEAIEPINKAKAEKLYSYIDKSPFYNAFTTKDRSTMNVTFVLKNEALLPAFLEQSTKQGLTALKGHRLVGGLRASIYNAMPMEGIDALIKFMGEFESENK